MHRRTVRLRLRARKSCAPPVFVTLAGMSIHQTLNTELAGRHIVLGLSGGAACFKAAQFCRLLVKAGASVQVVMTEAACQFITPVAMQALSGRAPCRFRRRRR